RSTGPHRTSERSWSVPVLVTVAEHGRCFEFVTRPDEGSYVRWTYRLEPSGTGTRVTEVWDVPRSLPQPPLPRPSPRTTLEASPCSILRDMSRPRSAMRRATQAGCRSALSAWEKVWARHGRRRGRGGGRCRGGGAKRPFVLRIRRPCSGPVAAPVMLVFTYQGLWVFSSGDGKVPGVRG